MKGWRAKMGPEARDALPKVMLLGWDVVKVLHDGAQFMNQRLGVGVICSVGEEFDGKKWLHVSASCQHRIPTWEELKIVKAQFIGADKLAIQVLPAQANYINLNPNVLHLWHCIDGDPVPDFARGGTTI